MDIGSSTASTTSTSVQTEVQKKAQEVQAEQIVKIVEDTNQQAKEQDVAKKTGIGSQLDIAG